MQIQGNNSIYPPVLKTVKHRSEFLWPCVFICKRQKENQYTNNKIEPRTNMTIPLKSDPIHGHYGKLVIILIHINVRATTSQKKTKTRHFFTKSNPQCHVTLYALVEQVCSLHDLGNNNTPVAQVNFATAYPHRRKFTPS